MIIFKNDIKIQDIYVGRPFFKKYNTLFNPDSRIIGYYNLKIDYNIKEEKNNNIKVQTNNDTDIENIKTDKNEENKKKIENGKNNVKTKTPKETLNGKFVVSIGLKKSLMDSNLAIISIKLDIKKGRRHSKRISPIIKIGVIIAYFLYCLTLFSMSLIF